MEAFKKYLGSLERRLPIGLPDQHIRTSVFIYGRRRKPTYEFKSRLRSRPTWVQVYMGLQEQSQVKIDAHDAYILYFGCSTFAQKSQKDSLFNAIGHISKFQQSQWESLKQICFRNLSGCRNTVFWSNGAVYQFEPIRERIQGVCHAPKDFIFNSLCCIRVSVLFSSCFFVKHMLFIALVSLRSTTMDQGPCSWSLFAYGDESFRIKS